MNKPISELKNPVKEVRTETGKADPTRDVVFAPRADIVEVNDNMLLYVDLPGVQAGFATWQSVINNRFTEIGVRCAPVASATPGAYGTARASNADDTRWTGGRWYAILGFTVQIPVTTVSFKGPMWGNFRFGASAGGPFLYTDNYFLQLSQWFNEPLIPVFNGYDAGSVLLEVADGEASTSPKVDILAVECLNNPMVG